jgi:hypothetical protein
LNWISVIFVVIVLQLKGLLWIIRKLKILDLFLDFDGNCKILMQRKLYSIKKVFRFLINTMLENLFHWYWKNFVAEIMGIFQRKFWFLIKKFWWIWQFFYKNPLVHRLEQQETPRAYLPLNFNCTNFSAGCCSSSK